MDELNFDNVYEKIKTEYGEELESLRKQLILKHAIALIIIIILEAVLAVLLYAHNLKAIAILAMILAIVVYAFIAKRFNKEYKENYKELAIGNLIKCANSSYNYSPKSGISSQEYKESGFDNYWDIYKTEDKITGTIGENYPMKMAQVHTQVEETTTDADGDTTTRDVTTFLGVYGIITLPYNLKDLRITNNSNFSKFDKKRVEMESQEFEKYFDVFSNDRQHAMEMLTPDAIDKIVKLKNRYKKSHTLDITLRGRNIYFRVGCGDVFEPPTFKNAVDRELLLKYFQIIDIPREIYDILIENIKIHN